MVKILVFIPHIDMKKDFKRIIEKYNYFNNIEIELTYVIGTPESLAQNRDAEIYIARGMTYDKLKKLFPQKHIVQIKMTAFNILDALIRARESYHPKKIGLCIQENNVPEKVYLEEIAGAEISIYNVSYQEKAKKVIDDIQEKGIDTVVGAGTICSICDERNIQRVHIKTLNSAIEEAVIEAVSTAQTINRERTSHRLVGMILDNIEDAVICIDHKGVIQRLNNQAYKMFSIPITNNLSGEKIDKIYPHFGWRKIINEKNIGEEIIEFNKKSYYIGYKPVKVDGQVESVVITCRNAENIEKEESKLRKKLSEKGLVAKYNFTDIIGTSKIMQSNIKVAKRYSQVDSNVLIIGETGTGKELFAHSIHNNSPRKEQPFVAINCAALPENLLESELFGYETGAFSGASKNGKIGLFELAHKGTIFLDEIGEIPITLQAKLLRVLQEKEVMRIGSNSVRPIDVRVISATNINIEKQIKEGKFRVDLYYRLNLLDINIPPLRERKEDIEEMINYYLAQFACKMKKSMPQLSEEVLNLMLGYDWAGNVRELKNICERLMVLIDSDVITIEEVIQFKIFREHLSRREDGVLKDKIQKEQDDPKLLIKKKKQDLAKELGISRTTLWRMLKAEENKF